MSATVDAEDRKTSAIQSKQDPTVITSSVNATDTKQNDSDSMAKELKESKIEEPIYDEDVKPRVTVGRSNISVYFRRACRLLRMFDEITVLGASNDISRACLIVELLRKEEIGEVVNIMTRMHLTTMNGIFGQPQPVIEFIIKRGTYGAYLSGYWQGKVTQLFEKTATEYLTDDSNINNNSDKVRLSDKETMELGESVIRSLKMEEAFLTEKEKIDECNDFLRREATKNEGFISLPKYIQYASLVINPRLKESKLREIIRSKYGINVGRDDHKPGVPTGANNNDEINEHDTGAHDDPSPSADVDDQHDQSGDDNDSQTKC